jgi:Methionine synthase I (cobalamin-dependent), methyltransferase domain
MISDDLKKRILILDGATGTMIQRGYDIAQVHRLYIEAGADIIETDTFNLKGYDDSFAKAAIARRVADQANASFSASGIDRTVYVAGVLGPFSKILSMSDSAADPSSRGCSFDHLALIYRENAAALLDAGSDVILIETIFDALNAKAAIYALEKLFDERGTRLPLMISATINDASGRLLTGIQMNAFYTAVKHASPLCFGVNCSSGAEGMVPIIREISSYVSCAVSMHPNGGLPNEFGQYEETPEHMASVIRGLALEGCINIAGGCCGTNPEHIRCLRNALEGIAPRPAADIADDSLTVSGLEQVKIDLATTNFVNVGERTNVAGSRKFARLISEKIMKKLQP